MTPDRRSFIAAGVVAGTAGLRPPLAKGVEPVDKPGKTKNTKFAVNLEMWWGKEKNFLKKLEYTAALGFPAVELWPWESKDVNAVAETCERLGLTIAQFSAWGFKPGLNDPKTTTSSSRRSTRVARSPRSGSARSCAWSAGTTSRA